MTPSRAHFSLICFLLISIVSLQTAFAAEIETKQVSLGEECPIPEFKRIATDITVEGFENVKIISKSSIIDKDELAKFSGGVTLINQNEKLLANELEVNQKTETLTATGDIHFQNTGIDILAEKFHASKADNSTTLDNTSYQLQNNPGHGNAGSIEIDGEGALSLKQSSFTTCYGDSPDWQIQASEITLSGDDKTGKATNARFKFFDVPIFYLPYFSFPITSERKTGMLNPSVGTSNKRGFEVETPFYWNIAENMDATITPHIMSKRGARFLTEFRYLSGLQSGIIDLEYLHKDHAESDLKDPRYLLRMQHTGTFAENYRAHVDYTTISDDNYLVDIGSKQYNSNDAYLYQIGELSYFGEQWQSNIKFQDFEVLGNHISSYKTEPQVDFSFRQPLAFSNATFDIYSEVSRFTSENKILNPAERYHVEAGMTVPMSTPAWFFNSEVRLMQTYYRQEANPFNDDIAEKVSRTLPKVRLHGGINFDRQMYFNSSFTQTLEPQLQYLYVPYKDQSMIGIYDTTQLQDDYNGLFRDSRYSGFDRISQANQLSWGLTTRILDGNNQERFHLSVGQINYLNDEEDEVNFLVNSPQFVERSALAADLYFQIDRQWQFNTDIQYDTENDKMNKSQVSVDYHYSKKTTVQLNHRYIRNVSGNTLEQLSFLTNVAINKDWQFVGRMTQDLQNHRSLETYAGFQYDSCCWAVQFAYHNHINTYFSKPGNIIDNRDEFDTGFMIKFILKGLSKQSLRDTTDMLNSSIFGYKRPYFLNN